MVVNPFNFYTVIPQNFLFALGRKKIYAESDLVSIRLKTNRIPHLGLSLRGFGLVRNDDVSNNEDYSKQLYGL
jgi:hypothetical protein